MKDNFGRDKFSRRPRKPIPVKEGEEYEVIVEGIGAKGDGIARYNGYVIVVPGVEKGDKVKVKVDAVRGKVSFGTVLEKLGKVELPEEPEKSEADAEVADDSDEDDVASDDSDEQTESEDAEMDEDKE